MTEGTGLPALVSGASGFLGSHVVRTLAARGWRVRALTRRPEQLAGVIGPGVEVVAGDLLDPDTVARAAHGQHLVVHTAARVSDWGAREAFWHTNFGGTTGLLEASRAAGVSHFIHVSSLTVLGLPRDGRTIDETTEPPRPRSGDHYSASKLAAERAVREAHGAGFATTVVRPGAIWGPGDPNVVPRLVRLLQRGRMPLIGGGTNLLGLSYVTNLAEGIALAAAKPASEGQIYHLTDGEDITSRHALTTLAEALGLEPPTRLLPYWLVLAAAALVEGLSRTMRRPSPPALTRYGVRFVACDCRYDSAKARRELGYEPKVTFREGVRALATLGSHGR